MSEELEAQWSKEWQKPDHTPEQDRLPHLSEFHALYDARQIKWTVTLKTMIGAKEQTINVEAHGIFPALLRLDLMYRKAAGLPKRKKRKVKGKVKVAQL